MISSQQDAAAAEMALRKVAPSTPGETAVRIVAAFDSMNGRGEQRAFVAAMAARLAMRMCDLA
ncbi:hypothetical protein BDI01nite_34080 [Brevundimonas diminuta]|nr:hypothetical protein BDI01nite_34080 [Brevundimonas diminuta]